MTILTERFINAIGTDDIDIKRKYLDQVWEIINDSYRDIGGIKGNGFSSKEDMLTIPFWKMIVKNGIVHAVVMYKDRNGRKSVAMGTDGSEYSRKHLASLTKHDLFRSYSERSKSALGYMMKTVPWDILEEHLFTPEEAGRILQKPILPITDIPEDEWPDDAKVSLTKYPNLKKYGYMRNIGGHLTFKIMSGTPYLNIRH